MNEVILVQVDKAGSQCNGQRALLIGIERAIGCDEFGECWPFDILDRHPLAFGRKVTCEYTWRKCAFDGRRRQDFAAKPSTKHRIIREIELDGLDYRPPAVIADGKV